MSTPRRPWVTLQKLKTRYTPAVVSVSGVDLRPCFQRFKLNTEVARAVLPAAASDGANSLHA